MNQFFRDVRMMYLIRKALNKLAADTPAGARRTVTATYRGKRITMVGGS